MKDDGRTESPEDFEVTDLDLSPAAPRHPGTEWAWPNRRLTFHQRLWRMISVVGLVLLALAAILPGQGGFVQSLASRFGPRPQPPVHLVQPQDGLACLGAAAWAPDSRRAAFVGYTQQCQSFNHEPGVVVVYDAYSGQRLARFSPDAPIARALGVALPTPRTPTPTPPSDSDPMGLPWFIYDTVMWSPDGRLLAIPFVLHISWQPGQAYAGLLLVAPDGTAPRILTYSQNSNAALSEWDLQRGVAVAGPGYTATGTSQFPPLVAAPAVSYRWMPDGALVPVDVAPTSSGTVFPLGAVGNPDGGATFTIWQPGMVQYETQAPWLPWGPFYDPGAYLWQTNIATWSPDGRFLIPSLSIAGRLAGPEVPQPTAEALAGLQLTGLPLLVAHDAALLWHLAWRSDWQVAWRPDGRVLATYGAGGLNLLQLLDCASGGQLMSVQLPYGRDAPHTNGVLGGGGNSSPLLWSPDGSRLLLVDVSAGTIVVYGPDQFAAQAAQAAEDGAAGDEATVLAPARE